MQQIISYYYCIFPLLWQPFASPSYPHFNLEESYSAHQMTCLTNQYSVLYYLVIVSDPFM